MGRRRSQDASVLDGLRYVLVYGADRRRQYGHARARGEGLSWIVRYPETLPWRRFLVSLSSLLHDHEFVLRGVLYEGMEANEKLPAAFAGGTQYAKFSLYDWTEGGFILARPRVD